MNQECYAMMSDIQLKNHMIQNKDDKDALRTYVERRSGKKFPVIANIKDKDFDQKLNVAIAQKLGEAQ